jgi:hypothetical protein
MKKLATLLLLLVTINGYSQKESGFAFSIDGGTGISGRNNVQRYSPLLLNVMLGIKSYNGVFSVGGGVDRYSAVSFTPQGNFRENFSNLSVFLDYHSNILKDDELNVILPQVYGRIGIDNNAESGDKNFNILFELGGGVKFFFSEHAAVFGGVGIKALKNIVDDTQLALGTQYFTMLRIGLVIM